MEIGKENGKWKNEQKLLPPPKKLEVMIAI